jgi:sugar lactone lactonase YvrE
VTLVPSAHIRLGLPGFGAIVPDDALRSVFISAGPTGESVEEVGYDGSVEATLDHEPGANGMVLSEDGRTLYVALAAADAVAAIDTATFTEKARYPMPAHTCPTNVARTGPDVWIGYGCGDARDGGVGVLATDAGSPHVAMGKQDTTTGVPYSAAPLVAAAQDGPGAGAQQAPGFQGAQEASDRQGAQPAPGLQGAQHVVGLEDAVGPQSATRWDEALHAVATHDAQASQAAQSSAGGQDPADSLTGGSPQDQHGTLVVSQPDVNPTNLAIYSTTAGPSPSLTLITSASRGGSELADLAVSPDGTAVFAASGSQTTVDAFTASTLAGAGEYRTGLGPDALALSPDGTQIASTASIPDSHVYVWDVGTATPVGDFWTPTTGAPAPQGLAFSGDGKALFLVTDPPSGNGGPTLVVLHVE